MPDPVRRTGPAGRGLIVWLRPVMWPLHLLVVVVVVGTVLMGLWQLGVYDSRRSDERADKQTVPTVPLSRVLGPDAAFTTTANLRPVTATGRYAPAAQQFWVSGRTSAGRRGYWVVAPFVVAGVRVGPSGREPALLVVRGWSKNNDSLPPTPSGVVRVRTVLQAGEDADGGIGPDRTASSIRIPLLINALPYDLYSGFGLLTGQRPPDDVGLTAVRPPAPDPSWTTGLRNLAYAIQWWVFGAFALFMWWRMGGELVDKARATAAPTRERDDSEPQVA